MSDPVVLTIDIGTQSMRGVLAKKDGSFIDVYKVKYAPPYFSEKQGMAEQKPDFYFETLCEITQRLKKDNPGVFESVRAMTVTSIRDTTLCLDKNNAPLRNIILWLDKREAQYTNEFGFVKTAIFKFAGMYDSAVVQFCSSVVNWIMQNEPEIWEKTAKYVMLPTYINYQLTGELKDSAANMIGHMPLDYKKRKWMAKNGLTRKVCDVPAEKLCELTDSGEVIGLITKRASELSGIPEGLPLIATGSDKGCETLGLSVLDKGKAALSFGTTATVQFATKDYFEPQQFMPGYPAVPNDRYNPEIQIYRGYWMLTWFIEEFAHRESEAARALGCSPEEVLNKRLKEIPAGCDGLVLQPYWTAGITIPKAKGAIIGFSDNHTRMHLYRAIIEGVGFALLDAMYTMEKRSKTKIKEIYVGGGGAQSDEICRITADMSGLPVKRIQTYEACSLGSSMVAFVKLGEYASFEDAVEGMVHVKDTFEPDMAQHELYKGIYNEVYKRLYPRLEPLYKNMKTLKERAK